MAKQNRGEDLANSVSQHYMKRHYSEDIARNTLPKFL